jgi:signal transduction histidine kinase
MWRNVGIEHDDTSESTKRKLKKIIEKMDRINPPDSIFIPALTHNPDTLIVYELPPERDAPVVVTDHIGTLLYSRNIPVSPLDTLKTLQFASELDSIPEHFLKKDNPHVIFYGVRSSESWPLIIARKNGEPLYWKDVGIVWNDTTFASMRRLKNMMLLIRDRGVIDTLTTSYIPGYTVQLFHYGDPKFLAWIVWLPVIEFAVIFILIIIGFIGFKNITDAEQRSIWVGMAKETAHQLGTPISSITGWIELLNYERDASLIEQAVSEIEYDTNRLARVSARFSSIGSKPELQPIFVSDVIEEVLEYFRARVPRMGGSVILKSHYNSLYRVMGNHELLNWAFENLIKNALASIENKDGLILVTGSMSKDLKYVVLDFNDNGKGIPLADQKKIMKPGFTTKKRGWGLGLSLVKRIIEEYHSGKITLLESMPGKGSTFRVCLSSVKPEEKVKP